MEGRQRLLVTPMREMSKTSVLLKGLLSNVLHVAGWWK